MRFRIVGYVGGIVGGILGVPLGLVGYLLLCRLYPNADDAMFCIFCTFLVGPPSSIAGFSFAYWGGPLSAALGLSLASALALLLLHGAEFLLVLQVAYLAMVAPGLLLRRAMRASRPKPRANVGLFLTFVIFAAGFLVISFLYCGIGPRPTHVIAFSWVTLFSWMILSYLIGRVVWLWLAKRRTPANNEKVATGEGAANPGVEADRDA